MALKTLNLTVFLVFVTLVCVCSASSAYDRSLADTLWAFSQTAYCSPNQIREFDCKACKLIRAHYGDQPFKRAPVVVTHKPTDAQGFVMARDAGAGQVDVFVTFRGTVMKSIKGWLDDIKYLELVVAWEGDARIHRGFLETYEGVRTQTIAAIKSLTAHATHVNIIVTGHSLGGAMADIAALDFKMNQFPDASVSLYTFGCPRVGDKKFRTLVDSHVEDSWRVTHYRDMVVHYPPKSDAMSFHFHHVGTEVYYNKHSTGYRQCNGSGEDKKGSDQWHYIWEYSVEDHLHYFNRENRAGC